MKENAAFNRLFNTAAAELPKGFVISVHAERDAGWVELRNEEGDLIDFQADSESLSEAFIDAIEYAKDMAKDIGELDD